MSAVLASVHCCCCPVCKDAAGQMSADAAIVRVHRHSNLLLSRLNEPQRRWYVGSLSLAPDAPTDGQLSLITGLDEKTIRRGRRELEADLNAVPTNRQRHVGGGRFAAEKKTRR